MAPDPSAPADLTGFNAEALRTLVMAQRDALAVRDTRIDHLKLVIIQLRRMQFGSNSEKTTRQIEQWELQLRDPNPQKT